MAEHKSLSKPENVKTCLHFADHFCSHVFEKFDIMDEVHIVLIIMIFQILYRKQHGFGDKACKLQLKIT